MNAKRIQFSAPGKAELVSYEVSDPKPNEVQVRIAMSAISSGTERANLLGDKSLSPKRAPTDATFPKYLGYSSAGIVEKVGEDVENIRVGDHVALSWSKHAEVQNISASNVYKLGTEVSFEDACLFHIATFPLAAIRKCRLEIGESAIVMGMGILGLFAVALLKNAGAVPIIAVDPDPLKREKAIQCGADIVLDPFATDFAQTVKEITNGGARVAIEVTGNGGALDGVLDCMAPFGRVALLGCTRNSDFTIDYYRKVHGPGITLIGAHTCARPKFESSEGLWTQDDDMKALIKLTKAGRINLASLIDEVHSPAAATEIYNRLATQKSFPLVQFDWRKL